MEAGLVETWREISNSGFYTVLDELSDIPLLPRRGRLNKVAALILDYCNHAMPPRCVCDTALTALRVIIERKKGTTYQLRRRPLSAYLVKIGYMKCGVAVDPEEIYNFYGVSRHEVATTARRIAEELGLKINYRPDYVFKMLAVEAEKIAATLGFKIEIGWLARAIAILKKTGFALTNIKTAAAALVKYYCSTTRRCNATYSQLEAATGESAASISKKYTQVRDRLSKLSP